MYCKILYLSCSSKKSTFIGCGEQKISLKELSINLRTIVTIENIELILEKVSLDKVFKNLFLKKIMKIRKFYNKQVL